MTAELRLVYDADAPARPPRPPPRQLESIDELEEVLRELLRERFDGEVVLRGHSTAKICLYAGTVAWVRSDDHPEHLGDVLRRELGETLTFLMRHYTPSAMTGVQREFH